jgi:hypothetical protein
MQATQAATAEATATAAMIDATGRTMGRGAKTSPIGVIRAIDPR